MGVTNKNDVVPRYRDHTLQGQLTFLACRSKSVISNFRIYCKL